MGSNPTPSAIYRFLHFIKTLKYITKDRDYCPVFCYFQAYEFLDRDYIFNLVVIKFFQFTPEGSTANT